LYKVDLHVHTSNSSCYRDRTVRPEQIVSAALNAGMHAIAVTDHHAFAGAVELRDAARNSGVTVFPGVEVTAREGHFLGIFDTKTPANELADFVRWLGITNEHVGEGHVVAEADTQLIIKEIRDRGGLAIAAHIERWPSGFLESNGPRRVKEEIHASEYLSALEITIPQDKSLWNGGLMRGYPTKHACVQASDAHAPSEIGRRHVLIEMERVDLGALRTALAEHERCVVFPETPPR
jgi:predicted metal-dependent phosphoesterase TrpH